MKVLAIIPARGGSKRLPRKNIIDFIGKPIIYWTIDAAIGSGVFDRVVVSTEDEEIAAIAIKSGVEIDYRDISLSTDKATVAQVCLNLLDKERQSGREYDVVCCLYATSPLRDAEDIKSTVNLVTSGTCEQAMAVTYFDLPAFQAMHCSDINKLTPLFPDLINKQSSEIDEIVVDNGSTYVATVKSFYKTESFVVQNMRGYKMPKTRSVDIDLAEDLHIALYYAKMLGAGDK